VEATYSTAFVVGCRILLLTPLYQERESKRKRDNVKLCGGSMCGGEEARLVMSTLVILLRIGQPSIGLCMYSQLPCNNVV